MSAARGKPMRPRRAVAAAGRVRRMAERDASAAAILSGQLGYPGDAAAMRRRIRGLRRRAGTVLLVAEDADGAVVGWTQAEERWLLETGRFAELTGLVVDERARGRGAGRALVAAAEAWARARGHAVLRLRSNRRRAGARAFYERLGYAVFKTQNVFARDLRRGARGRLGAVEGEPARARRRRSR